MRTLVSAPHVAHSPAAFAGASGRSAIPRLIGSGVVWGIVVSVAVALWVTMGLGGADYYGTPLRIRAYAPAHHLLRPSGPVGQSLGLVGTLLMVAPFAYMLRKRLGRLAPVGSVRAWLEIHLFCGIAGPVLVTLHTSFKFNGIISAAYWSMVLVMLSGFVGRYLYVRIPRSIRGNELTRTEVEAEAAGLKDELVAAGVDTRVLGRIDAFEHQVVPATVTNRSLGDLLLGEMALARRLRALGRALEADGLESTVRTEVVRVTSQRAMLLRRSAYLQLTKKLFEVWHVFHLPLVYLLLVIAAAHIGLVLYMGYVPFRW